MKALVHALTIDVEDWNSGAVLLLTGKVEPPTRAVVDDSLRTLAFLQEQGVRATWFVLGEVAEHFPDLVRRIAAAGHELGVHGYHHELVYNLSPATFKERAARAKAAVEQAAGVPVHGYRAAAASITRRSWWALALLAEVGFQYDSSVFPFRGTRYGVPDAPVDPHWIIDGGKKLIYEVPLTVLHAGSLRLPAAGGGYFRHFPYAYTAAAFRVIEAQRRSAVVYLHPYDCSDATAPGLIPSWFGWKDRLRMRRLWWSQSRNRRQTEAKLRRLFARHRFDSVFAVFELERVLATQR